MPSSSSSAASVLPSGPYSGSGFLAAPRVVAPTRFGRFDVPALAGRLFLVAMQQHHMIAIYAEDRPSLDPAISDGRTDFAQSGLPDGARDRQAHRPAELDRRDIAS